MADHTIVIVFGRPGSGKTTISERAIELFSLAPQGSPHEENVSTETAGEIDTGDRILCLDLDVCVPQWMRDNFAQGIYPTHAQRKLFAIQACDYVQDKLNHVHQKLVVISFSFVNSDLRDVFRSKFPSAKWLLVDTNSTEAQHRIDSRTGHFYTGNPNNSQARDEQSSGKDTSRDGCKSRPAQQLETESSSFSKDSIDTSEDRDTGQAAADNSDWDFAPVEFDHIILDGLQPVVLNAERVLQALIEEY